LPFDPNLHEVVRAAIRTFRELVIDMCIHAGTQTWWSHDYILKNYKPLLKIALANYGNELKALTPDIDDNVEDAAAKRLEHWTDVLTLVADAGVTNGVHFMFQCYSMPSPSQTRPTVVTSQSQAQATVGTPATSLCAIWGDGKLPCSDIKSFVQSFNGAKVHVDHRGDTPIDLITGVLATFSYGAACGDNKDDCWVGDEGAKKWKDGCKPWCEKKLLQGGMPHVDACLLYQELRGIQAASFFTAELEKTENQHSLAAVLIKSSNRFKNDKDALVTGIAANRNACKAKFGTEEKSGLYNADSTTVPPLGLLRDDNSNVLGIALEKRQLEYYQVEASMKSDGDSRAKDLFDTLKSEADAPGALCKRVDTSSNSVYVTCNKA